MAKPTLGRGLGDLLGSNRTGAEPSAPVKPPGVGLRILIDGTPPQSESVTQPAAVPAPPLKPFARPASVVVRKESDGEIATRMLAVLSLIGADLGLLGWTAHHVWLHQHALNFSGALACAGSVLLAALCGCAAARVAAGLAAR